MDEAGRDKLWQQYSKTHDTELRDELILEYAQLVKLVAGRLSMYLGYNVEYDDLVGYGIFGLIDAIDKYDYGKNVKFETYASLRIRGAILDQIRKMDWIPRSLRQKQKKINAAMAAIEAKTGRTSTDEELAAELGISIEELNNWQGQTKMSNLISLDEYTEEGSESGIQAVNNTRFETPEDVVENIYPKFLNYIFYCLKPANASDSASAENKSVIHITFYRIDKCIGYAIWYLRWVTV